MKKTLKKVLAPALTLAMLLALLAACSSTTEPPAPSLDAAPDYTRFAGKDLGVPSGNLAEQVIRDIGGTPVFFPDLSAGLAALRNGTIDGFVTDLSIVRVTAGANDDLQAVAIPAEYFAGPLGAFSAEQAIVDSFNAFLAELSADGTLADMQSRWLEGVPASSMPNITSTGENGTLTVATTGDGMPFSYSGADGTLTGYSIELALRFAAREGKTAEFVTMDFAELIPYVAGGNANLGIDAVTITEERAGLVLFTEPVYYDLLGILALK
jgi:ABC-type amino acid transport substrate-binding protein